MENLAALTMKKSFRILFLVKRSIPGVHIDHKTPRERVYGCVGTVLSGWFLLDWLAGLIKTASQNNPEAQFEVVTRDDAETVRAALDIEGKLGERLSIFSSASERVHEAL